MTPTQIAHGDGELGPRLRSWAATQGLGQARKYGVVPPGGIGVGGEPRRVLPIRGQIAVVPR